MSNNNCIFCGKKLSSAFSNNRAPENLIKTLSAVGVCEQDVCIDCAKEKIAIASKELTNSLGDIKNKLKEKREQYDLLIDEALKNIKVFTTPHFESWNAEIIGVVSGYSVIGTGPMASLASAFADMVGKESIAYMDKIRSGETKALSAAKIQAAELGANMISGISITVTEATSGHGMLMISCCGTAISTGDFKNKGAKITGLKNEIYKLEEEENKISKVTMSLQ